MTLLSLALLSGCDPQHAEITADYAVYLAETSSENLVRLERTGTDLSTLGLTPIDCRDLVGLTSKEIRDLSDAEIEEIQISIDAARMEGVDYVAECCNSGSDNFDCDEIQPMWFDWLNDYSYYLKEGKVDAWRTEAVLTTEGDLQLTVHMDVGTFGDFRFGWVIDPDFQPVECVDGESGAEQVDVDGNWLEQWAATEDGGQLWHLNAGALQVNPSNTGEGWYFEQEWAAGYTFARFGDEEFYGHTTDYNDPLYRPFYQGFYDDGDCNDGGDNDYDGMIDEDGRPVDNIDPDPECTSGLAFEGPQAPKSPGWGNSAEQSATKMDNWAENAEAWFNGSDEEDAVVDDLNTMGKSAFPLEMKIENNSWRELDDVASGLDGWLGVSPSWVHIDNPQDIKINPDKPITGTFQVYLEGLAAASKVLVNGSFSISQIDEDVWGFYGGTMDEVKRAENNTPICGEERLTEDIPTTD